MLKNWLFSLWVSSRFINGLAAACALLAVLVALGSGAYAVQATQTFKIAAIEVTGLRGERDLAHQNEAFLRQTVVPQLSGSYFSLRLPDVQKAFAQSRWVRHVDVRRVWPNRIWVVVEEHQASALLNNNLLINDQGEAFAVMLDERDLALPLFLGDPRDSALLLARQRELDGWIAGLNVRTSAMTLSDRKAWTAILSNGMTLELGRDELTPPVAQRVAQWVAYWPTWVQSATSPVKRVDLRYPNGFAVQAGESKS